MKVFEDQLDRKIEFQEFPKKIVSLVPSQTELLVDLGLENELVGITKFCVHPKSLRKQKKVVGGTKNVHFDRISALKPDIILCNKEENTAEMVAELEKIAPVHVSDVYTLEDARQLILQYGELFNVSEKASEIVQKLAFLEEDFQQFIKKFPQRKAAYFIWKNPWMVAGKNNFVNHLLALNGFKNVFLDKNSRYPEIELKEVAEKGVELVLLSTEPFPFGEKEKNELYGQVGGAKVEVVDGEYFSWYGTRLLGAFEYFKKLHASLNG